MTDPAAGVSRNREYGPNADYNGLLSDRLFVLTGTHGRPSMMLAFALPVSECSQRSGRCVLALDSNHAGCLHAPADLLA